MTPAQSAGLEQRARELLATARFAMDAIEARFLALPMDKPLTRAEIHASEFASIKAALAAPAADGWRPIESAPKDGTPIIGWRFYPVAVRWRPDLDPQYPWDALTLDSHPSTTFIQNGFKEADASLSHWMPLPPAPQAQGEGA